MTTDVSTAIGLGLGLLMCFTACLMLAFICYYFCCVKRRRDSKDEEFLTGGVKLSVLNCCCCVRKQPSKVVKVKQYGNVLGVPKAPLKVWTRDVTKDSVVVTWTPHPRDTHYRVHTYHVLCQNQGSDWTEVGTCKGRTHQLKLDRLKPNVKYRFAVSAESRFGTGPQTQTDGQTELKSPAPPGMPVRFRCVSVGYDSATLSWQSPYRSADSTLFHVMIQVDSGQWKEIAQVTDCHHTACGLEAGKAYRFSVSARNKFGKGPARELQNPVFVKPAVAPAPPIDLAVSEVKEDRIRLRWTCPTDTGGSEVTKYHVMIQQDSGSWEDLDHVTATSYTATSLEPGSLYKFKVSSVNKVGEGKAAETPNPVSLKRVLVVPKAPKEVTIVDVQETSVTLTWLSPSQDGGSKVKAYHLQIQEEGSDWTELGQSWPFDPTYVAKDLRPNQKYTFRICAENKVGRGPFKQTKAVATSNPKDPVISKPETPEGPLIVNYVTSRTAKVCWPRQKVKETSSETRFLIEYSDVMSKGASWMEAGSVASHVTEYLLEGLVPGSEYRVRIVAINNKGRSTALKAKETIKTLKLRTNKPVTADEFEDIARSMTVTSLNAAEEFQMTPLPPDSTFGRRYLT